MNCQTGKSWARLTSVSFLLAVLWIAAHSLFAAPLITTASAGNAVPVWALIVGIRDTGDNPLSGGFVRTYTTGTNASKSTYLNATKTRTAPNPIVLDAYGRASGNSGIGPIYADGTYRFVICASNSTVLYTIDGLEFKSVAYPGDVNYTNSIIASLTATRIQIDGGTATDMTIDDSTITNSDITNASMSTVDMTGVVRIDQASITAVDLGTTGFTGGAGSVGHIPGTTATFSGDVTIGGVHRVTGASYLTGNTSVAGTFTAASGTWLIGYDLWLNNAGGYIYNVATPTTAVQGVNKGYVDALVSSSSRAVYPILSTAATQSWTYSTVGTDSSIVTVSTLNLVEETTSRSRLVVVRFKGLAKPSAEAGYARINLMVSTGGGDYILLDDQHVNVGKAHYHGIGTTTVDIHQPIELQGAFFVPTGASATVRVQASGDGLTSDPVNIFYRSATPFNYVDFK